MKKFSYYLSKTRQFVVRRVYPTAKEVLVALWEIACDIGRFISDHRAGIWQVVKILGGIIIFFWSWPLLILLLLVKYFIGGGSSNSVCPKCDSHNIRVVKSSRWNHLMEQNVAIWVPGAKISKPLNVCRDCGFSWDSR